MTILQIHESVSESNVLCIALGSPVSHSKGSFLAAKTQMMGILANARLPARLQTYPASCSLFVGELLMCEFDSKRTWLGSWTY